MTDVVKVNDEQFTVGVHRVTWRHSLSYWFCNCAAYQISLKRRGDPLGGECKHTEAVLVLHAKRKTAEEIEEIRRRVSESLIALEQRLANEE